MLAYLQHVVWRGVHRDRLKVLRAVLHGPPFKLRTPEELVEVVPSVLPSVVETVNAALIANALGPVTADEYSALADFVTSHCSTTASSAFESNMSSESGLYAPASKIRVVGQ